MGAHRLRTAGSERTRGTTDARSVVVRFIAFACNSRAAAATGSMRSLSSSALVILTLIPVPVVNAASMSRTPDSLLAAQPRTPDSLLAAQARTRAATTARTGTRAAATAQVSTAAPDDLGPSTAPPWNPPRAIARRETWERVILFPQRLVTLPLSGLGWLADRSLLTLEKTALVSRFIAPEPGPPSRYALRIGLPRLGDGTGMGLRVEARAAPFTGRWSSNVVVSHAATMRHYHETRVGLFGAAGSVDYTYGWRPEDRFYGIGMGSPREAESDYATRTEQVRALLGHGWNTKEGSSEPRAWIGVWAGPRWMVTSEGRAPDVPTTGQLFPNAVVGTLDQRLAHLVYG